MLEAGRTVYHGFFRYVQLETRLPRNFGTNKKEEGSSATNSSKQIASKRVIHSSNSLRPVSKRKNQNRTTKAIPLPNNTNDIQIPPFKLKHDSQPEVILEKIKSHKNDNSLNKNDSNTNSNKEIKNRSKAKVRYINCITDNKEVEKSNIFEEVVNSDRGYLRKETKNLLGLFKEIKK